MPGWMPWSTNTWGKLSWDGVRKADNGEIQVINHSYK